jgi:hypothetical protein
MDGKTARWLSGSVLALPLLTAAIVAGQGSSAMAQSRASSAVQVWCGSQYGTYVYKPSRIPGVMSTAYIQGDDGRSYYHQFGLPGNSSFWGLSDGDKVVFDHANNAYGGGGPTNICKL